MKTAAIIDVGQSYKKILNAKKNSKIAAIYLRVSTEKQTIENQRAPLIQFAINRGYNVIGIYQETASGKKSDREQLNRMLSDAHKGSFNTIIVWSLDRLSREGLLKTMRLLEHLSDIGVSVISYTEQYLDTTNELVRNILLAVLSTLAKAEREKISERTRAGLERLRKAGKRLGRPAAHAQLRIRVLNLLNRGKSAREVARMHGISHTIVNKWFKECGNKRGTKKQVKKSVGK